MADNDKSQESEVTQINRKSKGSDWSVSKCKKFARRFATMEEWSRGHQASYKAAASHNWVQECKKVLGENLKTTKVTKKAA